MAAQILAIPAAAAVHDGLVVSPTARGAETAWAMLSLARIALSRGLVTDAGLCLTCLTVQARTARGPVARRIRRDLPGLAGTLAVMRALSSPPALGATRSTA